MSTQLYSRYAFHLFALAAIPLMVSPAWAQGTATSPSTAHTIDPSTNVVWIGGPNDTMNGPGPIPIDLDVNGGPWRKAISASSSAGFGGGSLILRETILNAGTEPWTDWHEIDFHIGSHGTIWGDVSELRINGTAITYDATISGSTIDLDNFSQPVLPGDVFQIEKVLEAVTDNFVGPGTLVASIGEFPTTIPEPSTALLLLSGSLIGLCKRRNR